MFNDLPNIYKNRYPFRLGTTSFIYPDGYVPNAKKLGPYVDEIELLVFESGAHGSFPSPQEIDELKDLSKSLNLKYNIHLPLDIALGGKEDIEHKNAMETIMRIIERCSPLSPTTHTLHLPYLENDTNRKSIVNWQDRIFHGLTQLLDSGINPQLISIETLDYPFEWVEQMIDQLNLTVCLDIGHLILNGFDLHGIIQKHMHHTSIIHLHGVDHGKDHLSLDRFDHHTIDSILTSIKNFAGTLCLEVFSYDNLSTSLLHLDQAFKRFYKTHKSEESS